MPCQHHTLKQHRQTWKKLTLQGMILFQLVSDISYSTPPNTLSNQVWTILEPVGWYPSCLQITLASTDLQEEWQMVPQALLKQISTVPSLTVVPPTKRTSPSIHDEWRVAISESAIDIIYYTPHDKQLFANIATKYMHYLDRWQQHPGSGCMYIPLSHCEDNPKHCLHCQCSSGH